MEVELGRPEHVVDLKERVAIAAAYFSIRQRTELDTSAYVRLRQHARACRRSGCATVRQYLFFCTGKASKLREHLRHASDMRVVSSLGVSVSPLMRTPSVSISLNRALIEP